jgi:hypothetical protein
MAKYKPGQLFTIDGKIFRVRKCSRKQLLSTCRECAKENHEWCIFRKYNFRERFKILCKDIIHKGYYYPKYIKDNPLCVKD